MPQLERCSRGGGQKFFLGGRLQDLPLFSTVVALCLGGGEICVFGGGGAVSLAPPS